MRRENKQKRVISFIIIYTFLAAILTTGLRADDSAAVYRHDNQSKRIALTFDDGPHYKYTGEILDILKEYNAKATFFVVGDAVMESPAALASSSTSCATRGASRA